MSTQIQATAGAAIAPGDILVARQSPGFRMQHSLLQGFYLQDLLIEPANGRVSGAGVEAHLKPKAVEVLLYLAERPFELVEREELLRAVWGDDAGSSEALTHAVSELRSCCKDHANSPTVIQTVPRRGYRLLQQPRLVGDPEPLTETGVLQVPDDGSFIGSLVRRGVVQAGAAFMVFSWLLIQVADILTPTLSLPAWFPTLVTFAAIGGFPIVIVLAWMLERSEGRWLLDRGRQSGKMLSGLERNYLSIILAYGIAAVGALGYQFTVGFDVPGEGPPVVAEGEVLLPVNPNSIAVLRFLNIGDNDVGEIFSQGLGEDILDRLARVPGIAVSSRGDSWSLPPNASSNIVRRRLRVAYFLEGSVRVIGGELRVVVQLIESATGFHVFSRSFDSELEDHMEVQREITSLTVANLRAAMPEGVKYHTIGYDENPELDAYVLYRKGRSILEEAPTAEALSDALNLFGQAIEVDAEYSAAYAGICLAHVSLYELTKDDSAIDNAEAACGAALISNSNLDIVYAALGRLRLNTGQIAEAEAAFQRALEINPKNVTAVTGVASVLESRSQLDDAERMLKLAVDMQPGNWMTIDALGGFYYASGRYEEAATAYRQVVFLDPENWVGLGNLGNSLMMVGEFESAVEPLEKSLAIHPDVYFLSALGVIYYYLGEFDQAVEALREATDLLPRANFAWLNLGDALRFSSQPEAAAAAYRRAVAESLDLLETNPQSAFDLYVQAWATAALGDEQAATLLIERAEKLSPSDPYVYYYMGLVDYVAGDKTAALEAFKLAIAAGYPVELLSADPLLGSLQGDERFERLVP